MLTGQKYGEGDSHANNLEQSAQNPDLAANSANPAVKPTLISQTFDFDELVLFESLSATGKTLVSGLVNSGNYQPDVLRRALVHIAQTSDDAAPSEVVNGESLQSILTGKPMQDEALAALFADRITQIGGVLTYEGRTYVRLSDYLEQVTNSEEGIEAFRQQLSDIATQYMLSRKFQAITEPSKDQKVYDLHSGIALMVSRVGRYKERPVPNPEKPVPLDMLENPFQPEGYQMLMEASASIAEIDSLREWITRLQFMNTTMVQMNANLKLMLDNRGEVMEVMKAKLEEYEELIPQLKAKIPTQKAPEHSNALTHSFRVNTHHKGTSQAEILFFALTEYRDSRRKQYQEGIQEGEFENAYVDFDDYQTAQNILDELQLSSIDLANQNYLAGFYRGDDERFRANRLTDQRFYQKEYQAFLAQHGISSTEEKTDDSTPSGPADE
ncbi:hypothetical protein [Spirosoma validum]|uniref:Uncharacterized protein n=1 Tax=Spirosoma validum TaxID=2771355 RepID=A0A927AYB9_9BACT|nr:hypothetical protein [Spirosoma validum]MBD2752010.1 hypothetical protein [Spirosoma validum]